MNNRVRFAQQAPRLGNQYHEDRALRHYLKFHLRAATEPTAQAVSTDLANFGAKVASPEFLGMAKNAGLFEPVLEQFDAWGSRVDKIHLSEGWKYMHAQSAKEGLVALPYEGSFNEYGRVFQAAKLYLFGPSSALFNCPLAMTDGAAFVLRSLARSKDSFTHQDEQVKRAYTNLTTRDPKLFWTSGQWMTEKRGGSDVSGGTDTVAVPVDDKATGPGSKYTLHGYKWFTSATDSQMSLALARVSEHRDGQPSFRKSDTQSGVPADDRLSMFFVKMRKDPCKETQGEAVLNGIEIVRMKEKMGTKQLPTAELILDGTEATMLSSRGRGVSMISKMINITRYHNSVAAVSSMRRITNLALDFAHRRHAFGHQISDQPLHVQTLRNMDFDTRGNLLFVLEVSRLIGLIDDEQAKPSDADLMRVMTPLMKLFTAKETMRTVSEGIECFGGVGYMENSMIPTILRDAQVLPIWEGTTNILSLDLLRVLQREPEAMGTLFTYLKTSCVGRPTDGPCSSEKSTVLENLDTVLDFIKSADSHSLQWNARRLSMNLSRLIVASLACQVMNHSHNEMVGSTMKKEDELVFQYWVNRITLEKEPMVNRQDESCASVVGAYKQAGMGDDFNDNGWRSRL